MEATAVLSQLRSKITDIIQKPAVRSVFIISFFLFLSRGLGLLRQIIIYQKMDKISADLLLTAGSLPEDITTLLIMGTIFNAVLPIASKVEKKFGKEALSRYLNLILLTLIVSIGFLLTFIVAFTRPILEKITSPDIWQTFNESNLLGDYVLVTRILLLTPLILAGQSVFGVFLSLKSRFLIFSLSGAVYNIGMIAGLLIGPRNGYIQTAFGMIIGGTIASLIYLWECRRFGLLGLRDLLANIKTFWVQIYPDFIQTWKLFAPRIFLIGGALIANRLIKLVAQTPGQITAFDIALSIQGAFFTVITSVGSVFFPDLAKVFHHDNLGQKTFWHKLITYTENVALLSIFGAVVTFFGAPLVMLIFNLFGEGQSNGDYIVLVAQVCTLGLVFQSVSEILGKYFYVKERVWQPVFISLNGLFFQIIVLIVGLNFDLDAGVAVGLSLVGNLFVTMLMQIFLIRRDWKTEKIMAEKPHKKATP